MTWNQDPTAIAALLSQILNTANIPYYITDGVAAIAHSEPRATKEEYDLIKFERKRLYTLPGSGEVAIASPECVTSCFLLLKFSPELFLS